MQFKNLTLLTALLVGAGVAHASHSYGLAHLAAAALLKPVAYSAAGSHPRHQSASEVDVSLPASTGNFGGCRQYFPNGESPKVQSGANDHLRALCFDGFAVLHSGKTKTPVFSAEVLNRQSLAAAREESRTDVFFEDARLPDGERAHLQDYAGSGFDRGHTSPAGDRDNPQAMAQSFSLANMVPQSPENNRKTWAGIEKATRSYVNRAQGNVYVITGPVYEPGVCPFVQAAAKSLNLDPSVPVQPRDAQALVARAQREAGFKAPRHYDAQTCTIGNGVAVPSYLFKLVYDPASNRAWAHWLENTDWARPSKPISYPELVRRTGIDFMPDIHPRS